MSGKCELVGRGARCGVFLTSMVAHTGGAWFVSPVLFDVEWSDFLFVGEP